MVTKLFHDPEALAEYMADKTDEEKRQAKLHLMTLKFLKRRQEKLRVKTEN